MPVQDKTEPATPRKREEAREEGKVAKSTDVGSALVLVVVLLVAKASGPYYLGTLSRILREAFSTLHTRELTVDAIPSLAGSCAFSVGYLCLPIALGAASIGLAANVMQVGFRITTKPLAPNLNKLDPLKGIVRLVSVRSLVEITKAIAKITVVGYVVYAFLKKEYPALIDLAGLPTPAVGLAVADLCFRLLGRACAAMLVIAILDYLYQRFYLEQTLRMTKQEVKEEFKRSEGDPHVKGRMRQRQREISRRRMVQEVARADAVVTNPTHYAVAIKYDVEKMAAPMVVAKGQRLLAQRIRAIAEASGVPIVENPPVARLLYKTVEIGQQVPEELYQAVAEILAYVYRLNEKVGYRRAS